MPNCFSALESEIRRLVLLQIGAKPPIHGQMDLLQRIDLLFPKVIFAYGAVTTLLLHWPAFVRGAQAHVPRPQLLRIQRQKPLALICLLVGFLWMLQNIFFS